MGWMQLCRYLTRLLKSGGCHTEGFVPKVCRLVYDGEQTCVRRLPIWGIGVVKYRGGGVQIGTRAWRGL